MTILRRSLTLIFTLAMSAAASASVLFSQPFTGGGGHNHFTGSTVFVADNFTLAQQSVVQSFAFHVYHNQGTPSPSSIEWKIFDGATSPQDLKASGTASTYSTTLTGLAGSYDLEEYAVDIADFALSAGNYWLALHVNGSANVVHWSFASGDGIGSVHSFNGNPWSPFSGNMAFRIEGVSSTEVPEPGSLALLGLGLVGLAAARKRKQA